MRIFTTRDLANLFQVSPATIRREVERERLRCFYVGNEARFTQQHIDEYTRVVEFGKTTRELELEEEMEKLQEAIKEKEVVIENIKTLLKS